MKQGKRHIGMGGGFWWAVFLGLGYALSLFGCATERNPVMEKRFMVTRTIKLKEGKQIVFFKQIGSYQKYRTVCVCDSLVKGKIMNGYLITRIN